MGFQEYAERQQVRPIELEVRKQLRRRRSADQLAAAGWTASVETSASVRQRVTATRLLTTGVFAFALKKTTGDVYIVFSAPDGQDQEMVTLPAKRETLARQWAIGYNRRSTAVG